MAEPVIGTIVDIPNGRGLVRFYGPTSFSQGKWVGVELTEANGKNDGVVQGVKYFTCKPNHGVFVRPSQVKIVPSEPVRPAVPTQVRPLLGHQRTASLTRAQSIRSTSINSRAGSPQKLVTIPSPSPTIPNVSRAQPRLPSPAKRPSLALQPKPTLPVHPSFQNSQSPSPSSPLKLVSSSQSLSASSSKRVASPISRPSFAQRPSSNTSTPPPSSLIESSPSTSALQLHARPPSPVVHEVSTPPPPENQTLPIPYDDTELQELRVKVRVLEAKRSDDARHVRELETKLSEAESFVALRPRLQAKLTSLQTELIATRRELADSQQLSSLGDNRIVDAQEQLEMAMLDKEMAEERAELVEAELEELKEKLAVLEVEAEVLRAGGGAGDENAEAAVKTSMAYIQMEKQNERLKEALIKLRDISHETDQEQRRRISEMETDVANFEELQSQYESTLIMLANAETQVEDLKVQLDDALGAEEMLVQLTERNLMLSEKIEEMRVTIEDLEALKELNDELEENHVETEKSMQEEIESKDSQLRDNARKIESLEDSCQDLENTIVQFRELVLQLQSELDSLRTETQTAQQQSASAASQTAAMFSLNLRLQSTASKNQAKHIELEIKTIEAKEIKELLSIVQPYLPQLYVDTDSDATSCYLFFQRLAAKTDVLNNVVAQTHGLPDSLNGTVSEILVGVCEMRGRLSSLSILCKRFASILRRCDVESFLNIGRIYQEIAPIEKRIDMHIDLLRREEFREMECVSDVIKIQAQFDHLAETYFGGFDFDLGERELGHALSFDHDLDMFAASLGLVKTSIEAVLEEDDIVLDMGDFNPAEFLFDPLQKVLDQCRSGKNSSKKLMKRIEDLIHDSAALKPHLVAQLEELNNSISELINFGISLAQEIMPHLSDVRSSKTAFQFETVLSLVRQTAATTVNKEKNVVTPWQGVAEYMAHILQQASALLPLAMEAENLMKISGTPPWVSRVAEIKASAAINVEAESKVVQLNDEIQALVRSLKAKDQHIQEASVKIELMERRMETVKKQADTIADLESELSKARKQERSYEEAMEQLQTDLDILEQDNVKLKTMATGPERQASTAQPLETEIVQIEGNIETSYLLEQIEAYKGTVRFLRTENSYLKGQDLLREIQALPPLPEAVSRTPTPSLEPSGLSDTDDDEDAEPFSHSPPTLRSLATETEQLYRDVLKFSTPRVVDLSVLNRKQPDGSTTSGRAWLPRKKNPVYQIWERKMEAEKLSIRMKGLMERASSISGSL